MGITHLDINAVRNLSSVSLDLDSRINVFYGENGSGKTSILESIHLLGLGRSFRHHQIDTVIQYDIPRLAVFCQLLGHDAITHRMGLEKDKQSKTTIRINHENLSSTARLAELLPLQLIHPDSDELITSTPKLRRQFLDWGVFHVEQSFFPLWKKLQKVLKQRNSAIKNNLPRDQITAWDSEYVLVCEEIVQLRRNYLEKLQPIFQEMMLYLLPKPAVQFSYQRGWPEETTLISLLNKSFYRDLQLGYTYYGPQRDDILVQCGSNSACDILSRGEQKLVVIALRLAQGKLLKSLTQRQCLYLLDDFAAELDNRHRQKVVEILMTLESQVFLTTINYDEVKRAIDFANPKLFYVERGNVSPL